MKYFVLKPNGNTAYHAASRAAMRAYASAIEGENPDLARDLVNWSNVCDAREPSPALERR